MELAKLLAKARSLNEMAVKPTDDDFGFGGLEDKANRGYQTMSLSLLSNKVFFEYNSDIYCIGKFNNKSNELKNHWMLCLVYEDFQSTVGKHYALALKSLVYLENYTNLNKLGYQNCSVIKKAFTLESSRRQGLATILYKLLMSHYNFTLVGDMFQFLGARKTWERLSKTDGIKVDIIHLNAPGLKNIEEDIKIENTNDPRIWVDEEIYLELKQNKVKFNLELKEKYNIARFIRIVATCSTTPEITLVKDLENYKEE